MRAIDIIPGALLKDGRVVADCYWGGMDRDGKWQSGVELRFADLSFDRHDPYVDVSVVSQDDAGLPEVPNYRRQMADPETHPQTRYWAGLDEEDQWFARKAAVDARRKLSPVLVKVDNNPFSLRNRYRHLRLRLWLATRHWRSKRTA